MIIKGLCQYGGLDRVVEIADHVVFKDAIISTKKMQCLLIKYPLLLYTCMYSLYMYVPN